MKYSTHTFITTFLRYLDAYGFVGSRILQFIYSLFAFATPTVQSEEALIANSTTVDPNPTKATVALPTAGQY